MRILKNSVFLLILVFLIPCKAISQDVNWGELQTTSSKWYYPYILGEDDGAFYVSSLIKNKIWVEKFNKSTKLKEYGKLIELPEIKRTIPRFERIDYIGGNFVIFISVYYKKEKISELYAYTIDAKTGDVNDNKIKLYEIPVEKRWRRGSFSVFASKDKTKLLINHYAYYKNTKEWKDKFLLINSDLDILLEKEDVIGKTEKDYRTYNWIIDNDGSIYYIKSFSSTEQYIVSYNATQEYEKWEDRIDLSEYSSDTYITKLNFTINSENDLIVSGYYNKKRDFSGCFFMKIDNSSKEIIINEINEFSDSFRKDFLTERQLKKGKEKKIAESFNRIRIINKKDGGIVHIGEIYTHYYIYDENGTVVGEDIRYRDLVVLNISPEGELIWSKRIPKHQKFHVRYGTLFSWGSFGIKMFKFRFDIHEYFSYVVALDNEDLHIMFNDNPKNSLAENINERRKPLTKINKSIVMAHTFNLETGEDSHKIFHNIHDFSVYLKPTTQYQKDQNSDVIVFGKKKKKYKFGIITVN